MRQIDGILATPRVSRNKNFYFPEELARGHGMTVPLRWEHIQENDGIIGQSKLTWDDNLMQLRYIATVNNKEAEAEIVAAEARGQPFRTSLGVAAESHGQICHAAGNCYTVPESIRFKEMSVVADAGIPESTVNLLESFNNNPNILFDETAHYFKVIDDIKEDNTSIECDCTKNKVMSDTNSQVTEDTTVQVKSTEPETPVPQLLHLHQHQPK
jgi:hypothetical protein